MQRSGWGTWTLAMEKAPTSRMMDSHAVSTLRLLALSLDHGNARSVPATLSMATPPEVLLVVLRWRIEERRARALDAGAPPATTSFSLELPRPITAQRLEGLPSTVARAMAEGATTPA